MDLLGDFCFRREADVSARLFQRTNGYQERLVVFLLRFFSPLGPRGFLGPVRCLECVFVRLLSEAGRLTFLGPFFVKALAFMGLDNSVSGASERPTQMHISMIWRSPAASITRSAASGYTSTKVASV